MKLNEIASVPKWASAFNREHPEATRWLKQQCGFYDNIDEKYLWYNMLQISEAGEVTLDKSCATVSIRKDLASDKNEISDISKWKNAAGTNFIFSKYSFSDIKAEIPNCYGVHFKFCTFTNFKFNPVIHANLNEIYLDASDVRCGMLSVLKLPKLWNFYTNKSYDEGLWKAVQIINNQLNHGRNIPECQQELIEEGLQEYAKL